MTRTGLLAALTAVTYVGSVLLANVLTERYGLIPVGFGLVATAGTYAAGATLLARNIAQDFVGRLLILALMLTGCGLSWWLASPHLATASAISFLLSESTDMGIYSPLRRRGWSRAVLAASLAGAFVDTLAFLWIAGFPVTRASVEGQMFVKFGVSAVVVLLAASARHLPWSRRALVR